LLAAPTRCVQDNNAFDRSRIDGIEGRVLRIAKARFRQENDAFDEFFEKKLRI
jgi:hypothetical protein